MMAVVSHLRRAGLVVAATALMLSLAGDVSACSMSRGGGNCCASTAASACCCETQTAGPRLGSDERTEVDERVEHHLSTPLSRCECRSNTPTEPAARPRSVTFERRSGHVSISLIIAIRPTRPAIAFIPLVWATESPPGMPLYLRTSRLLT